MTHSAYDQKTDMNAGAALKPTDEKILPPQEDVDGEAEVDAASQMVDEECRLPETGVFVADSKVEGGRLYITLQGPTIHEVQSMAAKTKAYEARFKHGFGQAGIEQCGPPWPCTRDGENVKPSKETPEWYRALYKLTPG